MANVIAVIWDFDRTLVDGYMQDPIFKKYNVDAAKFWADMEADREKCSKIAYRVNKDTYYVNYFIKCAHEPCPDLTTLRCWRQDVSKSSIRE